MAYKSRKRNYKSRREKMQEHWRSIRITVFFLILAAGVLLFKNRVSLWNWIQTYFY